MPVKILVGDDQPDDGRHQRAERLRLGLAQRVPDAVLEAGSRPGAGRWMGLIAGAGGLR